jgi:hypothetical protein
MRARCIFHACCVCRAIGHNFALNSIVGIIPPTPIEPTIVGTRAGRGEKGSLGRPLRVIPHTILTTIARAAVIPASIRAVSCANFASLGVGVRGVGGEDDGSVGAPALLASVGVLGGLARKGVVPASAAGPSWYKL